MALRNHIQRVLETSPSRTALASTYDATIGSSAEITLDSDTQIIEVSAMDETILMRWGTANVSTTNFDAVISADTTRHFVVPAGITAVNFIQEAATAKLAVVEY